MNDVTPVAFRRLNGQQVEWDNLLTSRKLSISVARGDEVLRLILTTLPQPPALEIHVKGLAGEAPFVLSLEETRFQEFYPDGVANIALSDLPETLANALATVAVGPLMDGLVPCLGGPATFDSLSREAPEGWRMAGLRMANAENGALLAALHLSDAACATLVEFLMAQPEQASWPGASETPVIVALRLPGLDLSPDELTSLEIGSLILLPTGTDPARLSICLGARYSPFGTAKSSNGSVIVEQLMDGAMSDDPQEDVAETAEEETQEASTEVASEETREAATGSVALDDIGVRVCFTVGQTTMTFAELQALAPGQTIPLDKKVSEAVTLSVSGRVIGEGEIVEIDNRLGIRIVRLAGKKDGQSA